ncbi:DUF2514 family protein [Hydrogenophaga defluvii]|uniref:DUF2514 family protein n=1 Tax=Hydrogenophaga defluvii TaxID=249410 RepID=A0ABW2SBT5_9BURK
MSRILIAAVLALAGLAGWQTMRLADERTAHQTTVAQLERERGDWQRESRVAVEAARSEEHRRTAVVEKEVTHARKKAQDLGTDLAAARAVGERLRIALAAATRTNAPSNPSDTAGRSPTADPAADLLADVRRRLDEATDGTVGFADAAHLAGQTCERIFDQMNAARPPS